MDPSPATARVRDCREARKIGAYEIIHRKHMRYLPKSPADRAQMLREIGCKSIDDLFAPIPAEYRLNRDLKVPRQMAESEVIDYFHDRGAASAAGYAMFLGAGAYHH